MPTYRTAYMFSGRCVSLILIDSFVRLDVPKCERTVCRDRSRTPNGRGDSAQPHRGGMPFEATLPSPKTTARRRKKAIADPVRELENVNLHTLPEMLNFVRCQGTEWESPRAGRDRRAAKASESMGIKYSINDTVMPQWKASVPSKMPHSVRQRARDIGNAAHSRSTAEAYEL